ncbi:nucleotide sugar dehydrogenase [Polaribacter dokdonensis]|uniref:UDP-N-acetyl-D-galactosamine dehydrogenase n=1 Tax=Polaribacter dokdonensis DSW-5 TaxID=1300348 RepID=A0A0N0CEN1_9FLAO|nr:nucleotide sugar dehydrogenase [Polaribacter dokdonensis]KOY50677.1 UDP-glucose/GDP-mannose dehydrogenase [Polaribacter dokdonensis DSW-5]SEE62608.1 UDP-N-acetyl-D-galactosamine dehydrogenase [Polaribacter dokdonensis DSW-5]
MDKVKIGVIGLGYVGLPLAHLFAKKYAVVGFDINANRIYSLKRGVDTTLELEGKSLQKVIKNQNDAQIGLFFTDELTELQNCNYFIITVPTPVNTNKQADLTPLIKASETVGKVIKKGAVIIYESTVYPGVTEDTCVPVLEKCSGLHFNNDFYVGYSPERINPGDKTRSIENILKITSGSTPQIAKRVDDLYNSVILAGTHLVSSIKVAEAAKVIENSQRDINIAFVNELAKIFGLMNINTQEVLEAAATKWNFLPFKPGLVGGHCIGVDPYYLAQRAQEIGYYPGIILAGRRINDSMGDYVASQVIKLMVAHKVSIDKADVLILGIAFKENCPDIRNSRVIDVVNSLKEYGTNITIYDPWANSDEVQEVYGLHSVRSTPNKKYDAIVLAVAHQEFLTLNLQELKKENSVVYDVKSILPKEHVDKSL